jgi:hypothetical protein
VKTNPLALFFMAVLFLSALAVRAADMSSVKVTGVTYQGSGCPQGSVNSVFSPGNTQFSLLYDAFTLNVGGPTMQNTDVMGCEVSVNLRLPFGYTISVDSADFRGFVSLDGGVVAQHTVDHQVGSNKLATYGFGTQLFSGPTQQNYFIQSQKPNLKLPKFLACLPLKQNVTLMVRTRVKMTGAEGPRLGLMTVDSADGRIEQKYALSLRRCL